MSEEIQVAQQAAILTVQAAKDAEYSAIAEYEFDKNPPLAMAKLISKMPWGAQGACLPLPQCIALTLHWKELGLNPFLGDIFILPSGKIGLSLQGILKKAKIDGYKLGAPKFEDVERPWPAGQVIKIKDFKRGEIDFKLDKEPGVRCTMNINDQEISYTAWLIAWMMPQNPNWRDRSDWMLRVSAQKRCLALGTGIAVSEDIVDPDTGERPAVKVAETVPVAPKKVPVPA